jgi:16S rRNA (uracil1498-N3)-methyltransferase
MKTFYCGQGRPEAGRLRLDGAELHHAVRVLRLQQGEAVRVLDGAGVVYIGRWDAGENSVMIEAATLEPPPRCHVILAAALLKGEHWDWLIQKSVEVGVQRIAAVLTEHTVVRIPEQERARKTERWNRIAQAALKQSGQARLPEIAQPAELGDVCASLPAGGERWILSERGGVDLGSLLKAGTERIVLLSGPEGGWSDCELDTARHHDFVPISLGTRILRAETAALYALSAIRFVTSEKI